jgi:hypothetical protein
MTIPDFLTRADFPPLAGEVAKAVVNQGVSLSDVDGIFNFVKRFEASITSIADQVTRLRAVNTPSPGPAAAETSTVQVVTAEGGVSTVQIAPKKSEEPMPDAETGAVAGEITPIKIFRVALGALNKVPEETTVGELKAQAKLFKAVVLAEIQKEIDQMRTDAS